MEKKDKDKIADGQEKKQITLSEALSQLPPDSSWFKLTEEEKRDLQRFIDAERRSKKAGFNLGGSFYPPR